MQRDLAEETWLIVGVDRWVLQQACREVSAWHARFPAEEPLRLNVNVSARQLALPGLPSEIAAALARNGLAARHLTVEITESVMMSNTAATIETLRELNALGTRVAIDDFGTSYSSLSYFQRFPVDIVKLAKPFVDAILSGTEKAALTRGIIELSHAMNLDVVAEGIEESEQRDALRALSCAYGQGYLSGRPLESDALEAALVRQAVWTPARSSSSSALRARFTMRPASPGEVAEWLKALAC